MRKIFYMGPKRKTIDYSNFFDGSLTLFGCADKYNITYNNEVSFDYWNPDNNHIEINIYNALLKTLHEGVLIMAHNPKLAANCEYPDSVRQICLNDLSLLDRIDNKIECRKLLENTVPMIKYDVFKGCEISNIMYNGDRKYVIQASSGSGGSHTFLYSGQEEIKAQIDLDERYIISEYVYENTPYNVHCVIYEDDIKVLIPSRQVLDINERIEYYDSDFYSPIDKNSITQINNHSKSICKVLQREGYLGVLGIDYIEVESEVYFMEINPRFQGSSGKLEKLLLDEGVVSLFEQNYLAFGNKLI